MGNNNPYAGEQNASTSGQDLDEVYFGNVITITLEKADGSLVNFDIDGMFSIKTVHGEKFDNDVVLQKIKADPNWKPHSIHVERWNSSIKKELQPSRTEAESAALAAEFK